MSPSKLEPDADFKMKNLLLREKLQHMTTFLGLLLKGLDSKSCKTLLQILIWP